MKKSSLAYYLFVDNLKTAIVEDMEIPREGLSDFVISGYLAVIIELSEAIVVLSKNGMLSAAQALVRRLTEVSVHLIVVTKEKDNYLDRLKINAYEEERSKRQFVLDNMEESEETQRALRKAIRELKEHLVRLHDQHNLAIRNKKNDWSPKKISVRKAFEKAEFLESYLTYKVLCDRSHSNLFSIFSDNLSQGTEGYAEWQKPLPLKEHCFTLMAASEFPLLAINAVFKFYEKSSQKHAELLECHKNLQTALAAAS